MFQQIANRARHAAKSVALVGSLGLMVAGVLVPLAGFKNAATTTCALTDTQCVVTFGNARIAERESALSTLNSHVTKLFSAGRISSADNTALVADISSNESGLTALKGQLDAAPDAKTARADVKLIYTQFRIFAVVLPRDYHEVWMDAIAHIDARLKGSETIIQDAINGAPESVQGRAKTLFSDYQSQVSTAEAQTDAAQGIIGQLTPANFNASPTAYASQFGSYKTDIQTAGADTKQAVSDLHQIYLLLKSAGVATPTPAA
ncbi:MAG TPA: hypothetical protein VF792_01795 [Ktedonobacterales bacterium]